MASSQGGPGEVIHFTDRGMTKALGRSYGTKTLEWLDEVAHRLMAAVIVLDDGAGTNAQFHLVRSYARNARSGQRAFVVDPEVMQFFADKKYTLLQWEQRLQLSTGLSKWLHGFLMRKKPPCAPHCNATPVGWRKQSKSQSQNSVMGLG